MADLVEEIDDNAENVNDPLAVGQQEISEREIGVLDRGEHVLDLALEVEDPDRIDGVVGIGKHPWNRGIRVNVLGGVWVGVRVGF